MKLSQTLREQVNYTQSINSITTNMPNVKYVKKKIASPQGDALILFKTLQNSK